MFIVIQKMLYKYAIEYKFLTTRVNQKSLFPKRLEVTFEDELIHNVI